MRAVYISVIIVRLASSEIASPQGRVGFGPAEKTAIEQLFDGYSAAFSNKDWVKLREYLQVPYVRFGASNTGVDAASDWVVLPTMDQAINFFRAAQDALARQAVERFEWGHTRITALSGDRALVKRPTGGVAKMGLSCRKPRLSTW